MAAKPFAHVGDSATGIRSASLPRLRAVLVVVVASLSLFVVGSSKDAALAFYAPPPMPVSLVQSLVAGAGTAAGIAVTAIGTGATALATVAASPAAVAATVAMAGILAGGAAGYALYLAYNTTEGFTCWTCPVLTPNDDFTFGNGLSINDLETTATRSKATGGISPARNVKTTATAWWYGNGLCGSGSALQTGSNIGTGFGTATATYNFAGCGAVTFIAWSIRVQHNDGSTPTVDLAKCYGQAVSLGVCTEKNLYGGTSYSTTPATSSGATYSSTPSSTRELKHEGTSTCTPTAGGAATTVTAQSAAFVETTAPAARPTVPVPACPSGSVRTGFWGDIIPANPADTAPIAGTTRIAGPWATPTVAPLANPEYAECLPGGVQFPCVLRLETVLPDGSVRAWDRTTDQPVNERDNRCYWGTLRVAVAECAPLTNQDPPVAPEDTSGSGCLRAAVSFNPVNWVVVPLKCLFIPQEAAVRTSYDRLSVAWVGTAPGAALASMEPVWNAITDTPQTSYGCEGPAFVLPLPGRDPITLHPLTTCNTLTQQILAIGLPLMSAFIYIAALTQGVRMVAKTIGAQDSVPG